MLKRLSVTVFSLLFAAFLCSCSATPGALPLSPPLSLETPTESGAPEPQPAVALMPDNTAHEAMLRSFLEENYDTLLSACGDCIAGVGFIDLDLDGCTEMLLFDAGASASMGVQFFDIIGGRVECVSCNRTPVGEAFGGAHMSGESVCANYFDCFRLMEDKSGGERFFEVISFNGAADFSYHRKVRFGLDGEALTLSNISELYENYDLDTGELTSTECSLSGVPCTEAEYTAALSAEAEKYTDTGYTAKGAFMWTDSSYTADKAGLLAMADAALALSRDGL